VLTHLTRISRGKLWSPLVAQKMAALEASPLQSPGWLTKVSLDNVEPFCGAVE